MTTSLPTSFEDVMIRDLHGIKRLIRAIQQNSQQGKPVERLQQQLDRELQRTRGRVEKRRAAMPSIEWSQDLPVLNYREEIVTAVREHQVVVISGETGSGKSTQLPKICLEAGFGLRGLIGHTQPRRIAARSVAARVAEELHSPLGEHVGYKVRFTDKTNPQTFIKLMTDGILLAETQHDRFLDSYSLLIVDEAHERSLNIDFILGYLKRLLPKRPELRVIITSATIDADRFAEHFADRRGAAPILRVSGRSYPVEVRYRPWDPEAGDDEPLVANDEMEAVVRGVNELAGLGEGHVLVFLPTERDIREVAKRLRGERGLRVGAGGTEILPLYARLSAADQNRVFQPYAHRRIVLATNVAESSLTVPGIRYVLDTGTARISRYAPKSKVQRLPIEPVSRASADQRKGRCGRIAPGVCIRLYSEENYLSRSEFTTPEIQRTNLAAVILQAKALKLGHIESFPFLDPPRPEAIRDGFSTLFEIGAVDDSRELTPLGTQLSRFPVDPRIARIIVAADQENCLSEMLIIASALELQDPRERPHDKRQAADEAQAKFSDSTSDFISFLKIWDFYHDLREKLSRNQLRKACEQNFLSFNRMREWTEIHRQLLQLTQDHHLVCHARTDDFGRIHRALLPGFLSGIALRTGDFEYTGAGGLKFHLWPGSGLFQSRPAWCVVAEVVETGKRYGRTAGKIDPTWIENLAEHLVKRSYSDPHFHQKSGSVYAFERVSLYGMPVVARRKIPYGPIDPELSREIFIRDGLAERQLQIRDGFWVHNEQVLRQLEKLAAKTRRANVVPDSFTLQRFYDDRIPPDVFDIDSLRRWIKAKSPEHQRLLEMTPEALVQVDADLKSTAEFPDTLAVHQMEVPVDYHFAPGEASDGVTITVPVEGLAHLQAGQLGWMVPGLVEEKIVALIRSLPKPLRRAVIPAPDVARRVASELAFGQGDFFQQVAMRLSAIAGEEIPAAAFQLDTLPPHMQVNIRVVNDDGEVIKQSRKIDDLRTELSVDPAEPVRVVEDTRWQRIGIKNWDFGELPKQIELQRGNIQVPAYPTLLDKGEEVHVALVTSLHQAQQQMRAGVRRLYVLQQRKQLRSQVSWLPQWDKIRLFAAPLMNADSLTRQVTDLIADRAFVSSEKKLPRNEHDFSARLQNSAERIGLATQDIAKLLPKLFEGFHQARLALENMTTTKWKHAVEDIRKQLDALCHDEFLLNTPWNWLVEFPRYFQGIIYRLDRLPAGAIARDESATRELSPLWQRYVERRDRDTAAGTFDPELELYRWMLEEYRVSLFAQPLGTIISVSPQRLEKQWQKSPTPGGECYGLKTTAILKIDLDQKEKASYFRCGENKRI
jgi:ATP-dependent helicase HrpA